MTETRQGQVYWLDFGPASVRLPPNGISTCVVGLITSNLTLANAPGNVLLKKGEARLPKTSVVNVSQILTVDKEELVDTIGKLSAAAAQSVRDGLHLLFERL